MNSDIRALQEKRNQLLTDMQAIALKGFTPESRAKFDRMQNEVDSAEATIKLEERMAEGRSFERSAGRGAVGGGDNEQRDRFNKAFKRYAKSGQIEERDLLTTSDVTGGALIPELFYPELTQARKFYGPIADKVKNKITDNNGAPMKVSLSNDTTNGLTLLSTEGTSTPLETDPSFSSKLLGVDTVTGGLVKVSFQELNDSSFDLGTLIRDQFGIRYGRGLERAITLGTDNAGTALPNFSTGGLLASAAVGTTTAALADGIGWDDLTAAYSSLDPAYAIAPSWVMSSVTRSYLLGLKDGFGRPYFTPDPSGQNPFNSILGYEIVINQAMPAYSASAPVAGQTPILFGSLQDAYLLRTDGAPSILRLNERYADTLEVGFYLWSRIGGMSLNAGVNPLVSIKLAAA